MSVHVCFYVRGREKEGGRGREGERERERERERASKKKHLTCTYSNANMHFTGVIMTTQYQKALTESEQPEVNHSCL